MPNNQSEGASSLQGTPGNVEWWLGSDFFSSTLDRLEKRSCFKEQKSYERSPTSWWNSWVTPAPSLPTGQWIATANPTTTLPFPAQKSKACFVMLALLLKTHILSHSEPQCHVDCISLPFLSSLFLYGCAWFLVTAGWEGVELILSSSLDGLQQNWPECRRHPHEVVQSCVHLGGTRWVQSSTVCQHWDRHGVPTTQAGGKWLRWERDDVI